MIIQGDNKPIILEMNEPVVNIEHFSAVLFNDEKEYKKWSKDDIEVEGTKISLPLGQEETMAIDSGLTYLEVKFVSNGDIEFIDKIAIHVYARKDKTIFPIGGDYNAD